MISVSFAVRNPFTQTFRPVWLRSKQLSQNSVFECGIYRTNTIVGATVNISGLNRDHRGVMLELELFGYTLMLEVYDTRHRVEKNYE